MCDSLLILLWRYPLIPVLYPTLDLMITFAHSAEAEGMAQREQAGPQTNHTPNEPRYTSVRRTGASKPKACSSQLLHRDVASRCHDAGALKRKLGAEAAAAAGAGEASAGRPAGGWAVVGLLH